LAGLKIAYTNVCSHSGQATVEALRKRAVCRLNAQLSAREVELHRADRGSARKDELVLTVSEPGLGQSRQGILGTESIADLTPDLLHAPRPLLCVQQKLEDGFVCFLLA